MSLFDSGVVFGSARPPFRELYPVASPRDSGVTKRDSSFLDIDIADSLRSFSKEITRIDTMSRSVALESFLTQSAYHANEMFDVFLTWIDGKEYWPSKKVYFDPTLRDSTQRRINGINCKLWGCRQRAITEKSRMTPEQIRPNSEFAVAIQELIST